MSSVDIEKIQNTPLHVIDLNKIPVRNAQEVLSLDFEPVLQEDKFVIFSATNCSTLLLLSAINKSMKLKKYLALGIHLGDIIYVMDSNVDYIGSGDMLLVEKSQNQAIKQNGDQETIEQGTEIQ